MENSTRERNRVIFRMLCIVIASLLGPVIYAQSAGRLPEEIIVQGERLYYSQDSTVLPVLTYQQEFFNSFEPQSVGDMLKRVSGVAFSSDIGEFEAPQLRGLAPQYTQVLINGERIAGVSDDRVALVDRIPAELIERIEVIRSPGADIDSQGIGGSINLVLKESSEYQGGDWRLGGLYYGDVDPTLKGSGAVSFSNHGNNWSSLLSINIQERMGPKTKNELAYDSENKLQQRFESQDVYDSRDGSLFSSVSVRMSEQEKLNLRFSLIESQIDELENFQLFDENLSLDDEGLESRDSDQSRWDMGLSYENSISETTQYRFSASGSRFSSESKEQELLQQENLFETQLDQLTEIDDLDLLLSAGLSYQLSAAHQLQFGLGVSTQDREAQQSTFELEDDELVNTSPENSSYRIEEIRNYFYVKDLWQLSINESIEFGIRAEDTKIEQRGNAGRSKDSQFELNPSFHYLRNFSSQSQFRFSLARTLRRPNFSEVIPFTSRDSPSEDQVTIGNPGLTPETSNGIDIGFSYRLLNGGILGINAFYREIDDKIELTQIEEDQYSPKNVGRGKTWGIELDYGTSLEIIGEQQLSLFSNLTFIESEIQDPFTRKQRRFNLQPHFIGNIDLVHSIPYLDLSHGVSFQKQSGINDSQFDESKHVRYGTNLEYFLEKSVRDSLTVRFSISNALDAQKRETGFLFDGLSSLIDGNFEERVYEVEEAEPVFLLTVRGKF